MSAEQRLAHVQGVFNAGEVVLVTESFNGRYLAPQETAYAYQADRPDAEVHPRGYALWDALNSARFDVDIEICYCSVFDQCWRARFPEQSLEEVAQCVAPVREE